MSAVIKQAKPGETDVEKLAEVINLAYRGQGGWTTEVSKRLHAANKTDRFNRLTLSWANV